jgi:Uma2 family endonuclease
MAMSAAIATLEKINPKKRLISLEKFLERYNNREDPFKYEWNKGFIEKKEKTMNRNQFLIIRALMLAFDKTLSKKKGGLIIPEVDMYLPSVDRTRRADIAFLPNEQLLASKDGEATVCPFVIEVISKNDQINEVGEKIIEYFENGIKAVWVIFPKLKKVEVYTSVKNVTICFGEDICRANPVMDDFNISVNELLT